MLKMNSDITEKAYFERKIKRLEKSTDEMTQIIRVICDKHNYSYADVLKFRDEALERIKGNYKKPTGELNNAD